ncbi:hypothetical protein ACM01_11200 [Streptomyces viridochromogenes]|uniref:Uncharacterized protein n=1 Tax=Streptomyces viridochromogenes TaxID=1938 RepID=A0A0J8CBH6_STRVR|nr:hypothetical protein ACM01_11200 [Streptomyces viridochromogenes]KOG09558.1 hypothetical protein ADK35_39510 [Streptomyces viridochromogenes]KOG09897.1 hypothetical protein ADK36_39975 [Streptomyces viridochromogenes]
MTADAHRITAVDTHLSMSDHLALSGTTDDRVIEYVDHLHEHFAAPVEIRDGHYAAPLTPGFSATVHAGSVGSLRCPDGAFRAADLAGVEDAV